MPIRNERRNLERLEARRSDLEREIGLERNLTVDEPVILGAAVVLRPAPKGPSGAAYGTPTVRVEDMNDERSAYGKDDMRRDLEVEAVGMQVAMAYERERGWHPEDVSGENLGFDVRSTHYDEQGALEDVRYVEVKARARSGAIRLSANEWKKARQFGDRYWLYVVTEAATDEPQLQRIRDPAGRFQVGEDIFSTGFIIPEDRWRERAE